MSDDELRPMHVEYDCSAGTGKATHVSDEEWGEIKKREEEIAAAAVNRAKEDEELRQAVENHPDPVVQALAKKARII